MLGHLSWAHRIPAPNKWPRVLVHARALVLGAYDPSTEQVAGGGTQNTSRIRYTVFSHTFIYCNCYCHICCRYDIHTTQIISVYENNSKELLDCYERCADQFRDDASGERTSYLSTPENSLHSRAS